MERKPYYYSSCVYYNLQSKIYKPFVNKSINMEYNLEFSFLSFIELKHIKCFVCIFRHT